MAMAAEEKESYGQALAQAEDDTDLVDKLMKKIAVQAIQLGNLGNAFNGSAEYIELCESKIKELEIAARLQHFNKEAEHDHSEGATKRQDVLSARLCGRPSHTRQCQRRSRYIAHRRLYLCRKHQSGSRQPARQPGHRSRMLLTSFNPRHTQCR